MNPSLTGTVVWFSAQKGYGFILHKIDGVQQEDLFVHFSDVVVQDNSFRTLHKGQLVQYDVGQNHHGKPKAINVVVLPH